MLTRSTFIYAGRVQGVGFRYTVLSLAADYPDVSGTVQNLPDGRVEMVAEGPSEHVQALHNAISAQMGSYIRSVAKTESPHVEGLTGFTILR